MISPFSLYPHPNRADSRKGSPTFVTGFFYHFIRWQTNIALVHLMPWPQCSRTVYGDTLSPPSWQPSPFKSGEALVNF